MKERKIRYNEATSASSKVNQYNNIIDEGIQKIMQDNIKFIVSIVVSIITICTLIYNTFFKGRYKREREYYNKVLMPFIKKLKAGNENALKEIKKKISTTDEFVPKYVIYLMDSARNTKDAKLVDEKLAKIFIYDYLDIYPNDNSRMSKLMRIIREIMEYVCVFVAYFFLLLGCIFIVMALRSFCVNVYDRRVGLLSDPKTNMVVIHLILFAIAFWALCYGILFTIKIINDDRYTIQKKEIEKMIQKKVKIYDKRHDKYVY